MLHSTTFPDENFERIAERLARDEVYLSAPVMSLCIRIMFPTTADAFICHCLERASPSNPDEEVGGVVWKMEEADSVDSVNVGT